MMSTSLAVAAYWNSSSSASASSSGKWYCSRWPRAPPRADLAPATEGAAVAAPVVADDDAAARDDVALWRALATPAREETEAPPPPPLGERPPVARLRNSPADPPRGRDDWVAEPELARPGDTGTVVAGVTDERRRAAAAAAAVARSLVGPEGGSGATGAGGWCGGRRTPFLPAAALAGGVGVSDDIFFSSSNSNRDNEGDVWTARQKGANVFPIRHRAFLLGSEEQRLFSSLCEANEDDETTTRLPPRAAAA